MVYRGIREIKKIHQVFYVMPVGTNFLTIIESKKNLHKGKKSERIKEECQILRPLKTQKCLEKSRRLCTQI